MTIIQIILKLQDGYFLTVLFANIDLHFDKAFRINFEDRLRNFERKRLNNSKEAIGKECSDN